MFVKLRAMKFPPVFDLGFSIFSGGAAGAGGDGGTSSSAGRGGGGGTASSAEGRGGGGTTSCAETTLVVMTSPARRRATVFFTLTSGIRITAVAALSGNAQMIPLN
jgi:hypothetical protein